MAREFWQTWPGPRPIDQTMKTTATEWAGPNVINLIRLRLESHSSRARGDSTVHQRKRLTFLDDFGWTLDVLLLSAEKGEEEEAEKEVL